MNQQETKASQREHYDAKRSLEAEKSQKGIPPYKSVLRVLEVVKDIP